MSKPLPADDVRAALTGLPGWALVRNALEKTFTFDDFRAAMAFMVRVGFEAEAADHHPEWTNVYNRVTIRLNTHSEGGRVTSKDVALAERIEKIAA